MIEVKPEQNAWAFSLSIQINDYLCSQLMLQIFMVNSKE